MPRISISRVTGRQKALSVVPTGKDLGKCLYVLCGTLERIFEATLWDSIVLVGPRHRAPTVLKQSNPRKVFVRVKPTPHMLEIGCDNCAAVHNNRNVHCAANTPESLLHVRGKWAYAGRERAGRYRMTVVRRAAKRAIVEFALER